MPVDDCCLTFEKLATNVLPGYMEQLQEQLTQAVPLCAFAEKGVGPVTLRRRFGYDRDPRGCYVLLDGDRPVYVGISKHVIARLMEHVRGTDHLTATLAYRIAVAEHPHAVTAQAAMDDAVFHAYFEAARTSLLDWRAAFIAIDNPLELYVFEAYAALELDTGCDAGGWNTFATH
jgi:predicted GIY-YIG superfamily endonuclease